MLLASQEHADMHWLSLSLIHFSLEQANSYCKGEAELFYAKTERPRFLFVRPSQMCDLSLSYHTPCQWCLRSAFFHTVQTLQGRSRCV